MSEITQLVSGDTGSKFIYTLLDGGTGAVIDVTGATVRLKYRIAGGSLNTKVMTIESATGGVVSYTFGSGDLTSGDFEGEIEITDSGGKVITSIPTIKLNVRAKV